MTGASKTIEIDWRGRGCRARTRAARRPPARACHPRSPIPCLAGRLGLRRDGRGHGRGKPGRRRAVGADRRLDQDRQAGQSDHRPAARHRPRRGGRPGHGVCGHRPRDPGRDADLRNMGCRPSRRAPARPRFGAARLEHRPIPGAGVDARSRCSRRGPGTRRRGRGRSCGARRRPRLRDRPTLPADAP